MRDVLARAGDAARAAAAPAPSAPGPVVLGDFPGERRKLDDVWAFDKSMGQAPADLPPPTIYFAPFDPAKQDPEWTRWQSEWTAAHPEIYVDWLCNYAGAAKYPEPTTARLCGNAAKVLAWIDAHPQVKAEFPFPATFRAFHYDGTDRIQVNPATTFTGVILQGVPLRDLGYGYYVAGHEMLHYVLDRRGVPGPTHHCLFVTPAPPDGKSYMERLADFLIDEKGYAHFLVRRIGLGAEQSLNPCGSRAP